MHRLQVLDNGPVSFFKRNDNEHSSEDSVLWRTPAWKDYVSEVNTFSPVGSREVARAASTQWKKTSLQAKFLPQVKCERPPPLTTLCFQSCLLHVILSCWGNTSLICILIAGARFMKFHETRTNWKQQEFVMHSESLLMTLQMVDEQRVRGGDEHTPVYHSASEELHIQICLCVTFPSTVEVHMLTGWAAFSTPRHFLNTVHIFISHLYNFWKITGIYFDNQFILKGPVCVI